MDKAGEPTTDYILTAGHCFIGVSSGDPIYHRTVQIGTRGAAQTGPRDAGLIRVPNQSNVFDDAYHQSGVRDVDGVTQQYPEGVQRCATGIVTQLTDCGDIVDTAVTYICDGNTYQNQVEASIVMIEGDSGGPMYRFIDAQGVVYAAGVTSCGNQTTFTRFQKVVDLPAAWNVTVSTN